MKWLNYHHLQYFAAVVEEGGLVPAATRMGVSHPTVSDQIRKLEEQLELRLFERKGRKLVLSEHGKMVYGYASQIFGLGQSLLAAVNSRDGGVTVLGRVGADSVLPKLSVRQAISPLLDDFEGNLRLHCIENDRERLIQMLHTRQLDVVLTDAPASTALRDAVDSVLVEQSAVAFFAAPSLVQSLSNEFPRCLDGAPILLPLSSSRLRRDLDRWFEDRQLRPVVLAEIEDSALVKAFGQEGRGVFVMPLSLSREVERRYQVQCIGHAASVEACVYAVVLRDVDDSPLARAFLRRSGAKRSRR